jgi:hypothetical protein
MKTNTTEINPTIKNAKAPHENPAKKEYTIKPIINRIRPATNPIIIYILFIKIRFSSFN